MWANEMEVHVPPQVERVKFVLVDKTGKEKTMMFAVEFLEEFLESSPEDVWFQTFRTKSGYIAVRRKQGKFTDDV